MSGKGAYIGIDPRVSRTRVLLAEALMSLGAERDIETIEIGDLVEEAGIARSTFYAHFAGKDDFLVRSFVNMIAATETACRKACPESTAIIPSAPLFHHVHEARDFALRIAQSEVFPHQMAAGEAKLRDIAETNLARLKPEWNADQRREAAIYISGGFIGLLRWWMQSGLKQDAAKMQSAFDRLTRSVLETRAMAD
jgi:AcrR family transcriptional regulator